MSGDVLTFPERRPAPVPPWLPASVRRELAEIEQWCVSSQHRLAALPGASREHQRTLRRIANALRDELLTAWSAGHSA